MGTLELRRYLLMTLDPVHIGTGGYRLGRVDNSIVRDPGTNLPKIPGTSLHGAMRAYAARLWGNPNSAGKDHSKIENPDLDPVCYTFGYIKGPPEDQEEEPTQAYSGVVNVFDAHLALFPVHSLVGPVWVGSPSLLKEAGFTVTDLPPSWDPGSALFTWPQETPINLGWLMLAAAGQVTVTPHGGWNGARWDVVKERLVLVQEPLFGQVVNSNLEVRTSVSIDPLTGAAAEGALFTYEALPRATFLVMDVVIDDYRDCFTRIRGSLDKVVSEMLADYRENLLQQPCRPVPRESPPSWESPADVLQAGLHMLAWLGVGGMGTRGFGRLASVGEPIITTPEEVRS